MGISEKAIAILKALDYTPAKLAKSTQISPYRAKKIFNESDINCDEFLKICNLLNIEPYILNEMVSAKESPLNKKIQSVII